MQRGDVVLVRFPFSSGTSAKVRPAVVVQNDANNRRLNSTIVAMITSNTRLASAEPTQLVIDPATPEGRQSGLLHQSSIKCENLLTLEQSMVLRRIGSLPSAAMTRVDACLKASLELT
jgi:mRNA interferase MazF